MEDSLKSYLLLSIICIFVLVGCNDKTINTISSSTSDFAVYLLRDSSITTSQVWNTPLDKLDLLSEPFLSIKDIKVYYWSTHSFDVQPHIDTILNAMGKLGGKSSGVPFVVTVGTDRIYLGTFWWGYSSSMPPVTSLYLYPHPYQLRHSSYTLQPDRRNDKRIHDALLKAKILIE
jgi:hypothetical protein